MRGKSPIFAAEPLSLTGKLRQTTERPGEAGLLP